MVRGDLPELSSTINHLEELYIRRVTDRDQRLEIWREGRCLVSFGIRILSEWLTVIDREIEDASANIHSFSTSTTGYASGSAHLRPRRLRTYSKRGTR